MSYRHPRCYANMRGGCDPKISGEHYISEGLLKLYGGDKPMVTPDPAYGMPVSVQGKKFVAKVLCRKHNNDLRSADAAAVNFARPLKELAERHWSGGEWGPPETFEVSGADLQRWALKLLITHAVAGKLKRGEQVIPMPVNSKAIDLLLGHREWPRTWGLAIGAPDGNTNLTANPMTRAALTNPWSAIPFADLRTGALCGGIVDLAGVSFAISLFDQGGADSDNIVADYPDHPFHRAVRRPSHIGWKRNGVEKRIRFTWNDPWQHTGRTYTYS